MYLFPNIVFSHDFNQSSIKAFNPTNLLSLLLKCNSHCFVILAINNFLSNLAHLFLVYKQPGYHAGLRIFIYLEYLFWRKVKTEAKLPFDPSKVASYCVWEIVELVMWGIYFEKEYAYLVQRVASGKVPPIPVQQHPVPLLLPVSSILTPIIHVIDMLSVTAKTVVQRGLNPSLPWARHWFKWFPHLVHHREEMNTRNLAEAWVLWRPQWTSQMLPFLKNFAQSSLSGQPCGSPCFSPFQSGHFSLLPTSSPPSSPPTARKPIHRAQEVSQETESWGFPLPWMVSENS